MTLPNRDDELPRDERLQAALRHAPDHEQQAPESLSRRILAEAEAELRAARGTRQALPAMPAGAASTFVERWFGWLTRPAYAGALGSLMLAGVIGLLWREGPPPEALPDFRAPPTASITLPPPTPSLPPTPAAEADTTPSRPAVAATAEKAPREATAASPGPARQAKTVPAAAQNDAGAGPAAPPPMQTKPAPAANEPIPTAAHPAAAVAPAEPSTRLPGPAPAPEPAPPPPRPAAAAGPAPTARLGAPVPAAQGRERLESGERRESRNTQETQASKSAMVSGEGRDPLASAMVGLDPTADRALRQRLEALQRRVISPWLRTAALPPTPGEVITRADSTALGRLWIEASRVTWQVGDGTAWSATLAP